MSASEPRSAGFASVLAYLYAVSAAAFAFADSVETAKPASGTLERFDVVIVGGTPAGIMAAIAVARGEHRAVILERGRHIDGLPAASTTTDSSSLPCAVTMR